jgi:hypothetical protein
VTKIAHDCFLLRQNASLDGRSYVAATTRRNIYIVRAAHSPNGPMQTSSCCSFVLVRNKCPPIVGVSELWEAFRRSCLLYHSTRNLRWGSSNQPCGSLPGTIRFALWRKRPVLDGWLVVHIYLQPKTRILPNVGPKPKGFWAHHHRRHNRLALEWEANRQRYYNYPDLSSSSSLISFAASCNMAKKKCTHQSVGPGTE